MRCGGGGDGGDGGGGVAARGGFFRSLVTGRDGCRAALSTGSACTCGGGARTTGSSSSSSGGEASRWGSAACDLRGAGFGSSSVTQYPLRASADKRTYTHSASWRYSDTDTVLHH